jgi:hypothetical protein
VYVGWRVVTGTIRKNKKHNYVPCLKAELNNNKLIDQFCLEQLEQKVEINMELTIDQLRAAFKKNDNQGNSSRPNNYYPFWNMKFDEEAVIRFLPDKNTNNPKLFVVEKMTHALTINGEKKTVPCLKMYKEDCPICKLSQHYYKAGDKVNGKKYWRTSQHIAQALVVQDPLEPNKETGETHQGKVRFIAFGFQLYNVIKAAFETGDLEAVPTSYGNGYNFHIKKTKQGDYPSYVNGTRFRPKQIPLTEQEIELAEENIVDLVTLLPAHPGLEKVESMLNAAMTGSNYNGAAAAADAGAPKTRVVAEAGGGDDDNDVDGSDDSDVPAPKTTPVVAAVTAAAPKTDDSPKSNDADQILAQIRARRQASAAKA